MDIDLAEALDDLIDHPLYAVFVANVNMHRERLGLVSELGCGFPRLLFIEIRDDNSRFFLGKSLGCMPTNPLRASGHDNYFSFKHDGIS
jgi:hypothetical protein